jgi:hypothetical protein
MIDELVQMALKTGHTLDLETVKVLRDMEILFEIAAEVRGEPDRTYSVEEVDTLTAGSIDLEDLDAVLKQTKKAKDV